MMIPTGSARLLVEATPGADKGSLGQLLPDPARTVEVRESRVGHYPSQQRDEVAGFWIFARPHPRDMALRQTGGYGIPDGISAS